MRDVQIAASVFSCAMGTEGATAVVRRDARDYAISALAAVEVYFNDIPVSRVLKFNIRDLQQRLDQDATMTLSNAALRMKLMHDDIVKELATTAYFLMLTADEAEFYEQPAGPMFGPEVDARFPDARFDIAAAHRCAALGQPTAAVFHALRAAELALQLLARRLRIQRAEMKEWGQLLKRIDGVLRHMEPRTSKRDKRLAYYSQARTEFAAFNAAWRRHVAHGRETYDQHQAMSVLTHVKALMQQLARDLPR